MTATVVWSLLETARRRGAAPAVGNDTGPFVGFDELAGRIRRSAAALRDLGVTPGDRVAIIDRNTLDHVVDWFATLLVGAIAVDVSFLLGAEEQHHILTNASPTVVLAGEGLVDASAVPASSATLGPDLSDRTDDEHAGAVREPLDPAVIAYTSGTTGLPKGVVHTHAAVARQVELLHEVCGYDETWLSYVAVPLFSLHGFLPQVAAPLTAGGAVLLDDKFDARRVADVSRRHPITYTTLSSPMIPRLLDLAADDRPDFSAMRVLSCGGSPLHPDLRQEFETAFDVRITQGYSCTEVLGAFVMDLGEVAPEGAVGTVFPQVDGSADPIARVVDDDGDPVPSGERGEIQFHRTVSMDRYWNDTTLTDAAFVDGTWYATGDIGAIDERGFLAILDRKKDVIIRGGFNIYSAEIERVLTQHPAVAEAAVVGRPDTRLGEVPVAFVVPTGDLEDLAPLQTYVRERLGRLKEPAEIVAVGFDDLPRNGLGKVVKAELRAGLAPVTFD